MKLDVSAQKWATVYLVGHPSADCPAMAGDVNSSWLEVSMGDPQHGWFIMENPIKKDDLGGPS